MNISICMVTMTPVLAYDALNLAIDHARGSVEALVFENGCELDSERVRSHVSFRVVREPDGSSAGVVGAMHRLWEKAHDAHTVPAEQDILVYIHDDCQILEHGWDERLRQRFEAVPECDAVGFVGGTGIGQPIIYREPYQTIHLARHNVHSNMWDAESHGRRTTYDMRIATADGCALAVRRSFLDEVGGWSWCPTANHGYDNGLACMLRRRGRQMWLVPVAFRHPSPLKFSGIPANDAAIRSYSERFGTDHENYEKAHRWLYDEFRDVLPFHV